MKILLLACALVLPATAHAWGHEHFSVPTTQTYYRPGWPGAYPVRTGWWGGPSWYYYPAPVYVYPAYDPDPVYVMQGGPPPLPVAAMPPPPPPPNNAAGNGPAVNSPPVAKDGAQAGATTYYCAKSNSYYPVVTTCPDGWVATPVKAPSEN